MTRAMPLMPTGRRPLAGRSPAGALVRPYILRRLKTEKQVIADLPDKTELNAWCHLSPAQCALYQGAVKELAAALEDAEGIGRKGVVLSFLMRFKQILGYVRLPRRVSAVAEGVPSTAPWRALP